MKTPATQPLRLNRLARYMLLALAALVALPPAFAQMPDDPSYQSAAQQPGGDPPSRVARLNYLSGAVTTEPAGASDWAYAAVNRPLTTGDQLWNDAGARSELHIGSTAVRLGDSTNLAILNLDDTATQLKVALGTLSTHVRELPSGTSYEIDTPNLALAVGGPGDYRVDVAPNGSSTTVTVRRGSATVYGDGGQMPISAGQQIVFSGTNLQVAGEYAVPAPDALDQWAASRDAAEDRSVSARYVSRDIPGYQDLDANGSWRDDSQYGAVWIPNAVPAGWAPYHTGHWIWQAPWGWTWIDDAPWGFAPYHYGRWAYVDDSWAWVPGPIVETARPCYAPALVAFVGGGGGGFDWSIGLAVGGAVAAGVAWFPLGPHEAWHPGWGGWSPHYYQRVNQTVVNNMTVNKTVNITNVTNITNINKTYINYRAPNAVTAVPATAFVQGQSASRFAQKVDPQQWRNAHAGAGGPAIAPVRQSFAGGLRNAIYQPPTAALQRSIVATRNPVVPAAYNDQLAQHFAQSGGRVPGAGAPVVKSSPPPNYAQRPVSPAGAAGQAGQPRFEMRNVQLVNTRTPVMQPGRAAQPGPANAAARSEPERAPQNAPRAQEPEPSAMIRPNANPTAPANGVPHPPSAGFANEARGSEHAPAERPQNTAPTWTQPHPPIDQQRANTQLPARSPAQNALPPIRAPRAAPEPAERPQPVEPWRDARPQEARPSFPTPPRNDYRPPANEPRPQPAPRMEPRPSLPPAQAPHNPPPHEEAPRPAHQEHPEQHSSAHRDEPHRG
ncbi:DUF6600 domain-containing protein [Burkholderia alba]|uniref:DUF6600 domain-containing protein n=1 Tax=Burkholderia alba TaxID=2683677 RepID=UPI002B060431|nr:DUF6600 domain-containing protein [Burkholderia alba]